MLKITPQLLALALLSARCFAADHEAWQQRQPLEVPSAGLLRLALPATTLNAAQPSLADLRLASPTGNDVPYVIEWPVLPSTQSQPVESLKQSLSGSPSTATVLDIVTGTSAPIDRLSLSSATARFIKAVRVEGSNDSGGSWQLVLGNSVIFRESNGFAQLDLAFPVASWQQLRVTLDDARSSPVAFTGASVRLRGQGSSSEALDVSIASREERSGETHLTLKFAQANPWLAQLRLSSSDALFHRRVRLVAPNNNGNSITKGLLYRTKLDDLQAEQLHLDVDSQLTGSEATLIIENADSPPLKLDSLTATRYPIALVAQLSEPGSYQLYSGHAQATAPRYDLQMIAHDLRKSPATLTSRLGPIAANPSYQASAALPAATELGAAAEFSEWSRRRPVIVTSPGVLRLVLDAEVLAQADAGLSDLRLVQDGRHLPFIIEAVAELRTLPIEFKLEPVEKQPRLSRWRLSSPVVGLPVTKLTFESSSPLFVRRVSLWHDSRDRYGNPARHLMGNAYWERRPGDIAGALSLPFPYSQRMPEQPWCLETDNGDNAPITLTSITAHYPTHALLARPSSSAPIVLYYGNPKAQRPSYDLALIQADLRAATKIEATLGPVEVLKATPAASPNATPGQGSPWLWAALGAVVVGLLFLVAKLLPKPQE